MTEKRKEQITLLLKSIETGEVEHTAVVNEEKYIQHNPQTKEGGVGLAELFKELSKTNPRVNMVRIFSDGDYVFGHTEYDFSSRRIGFEVFRFEGDQAVEHWDNIQSRMGSNPAGRSMVYGETAVCDLNLTEENRQTVRAFVEQVLRQGAQDLVGDYVQVSTYQEHSPERGDDIGQWLSLLSGDMPQMRYDKLHRILAEGNFVLTVCEGERAGQHSSFYDLYRLEKGLIVEHWDTVEKVPPPDSWQNQNGKF